MWELHSLKNSQRNVMSVPSNADSVIYHFKRTIKYPLLKAMKADCFTDIYSSNIQANKYGLSNKWK